MSAIVSTLTERQYTDMMLVIGADHIAAAAGTDAIVYLAIPVVWILGVIAFIAFKFRSR